MADIMNKVYGLAPMTLEEEINASDTVHAKRIAKITIVDDCKSIRMMLETIEYRAKGIPEIEDKKHLEFVKEYQQKVRQLYLLESEVSEYGFH